MSKHEAGLKRLREVIGTQTSDSFIENFSKISPDFVNYIIDFAYGDLYERKGITDKTRELAVVASLIGQGATDLPLKLHVHGMLNVGWTQAEVIEIFIHLVGYVGFPRIVDAMKSAQTVFDERAGQTK